MAVPDRLRSTRSIRAMGKRAMRTTGINHLALVCRDMEETVKSALYQLRQDESGLQKERVVTGKQGRMFRYWIEAE